MKDSLYFYYACLDSKFMAAGLNAMNADKKNVSSGFLTILQGKHPPQQILSV
jgi:hypothetical protein